MAHFVLDDAVVEINSVDLSDHVKDVTINYNAVEVDDTCMGDSGTVTIAGLVDWSATINFGQDLAAAEVDATLFPLVGADAFSVLFKNTSDAVSATNPSYTGTAVLPAYTPIAGSVGALATASVTLKSASGVLTRNTS